MVSLVNPVLSSLLAVFFCFCYLNEVVSAFSNGRSDNIATYWGQDSAGHQQRLSFYCDDDSIDAIPMAFLYIFRGKGGFPVIDFANICGAGGHRTFPGTSLSDCSFLEADIRKCQAKGKIVTLSLGGAISQVGFSSDSQAAAFGELLWDMFLGGNGNIRPLGDVSLDGIDLDIEKGSSVHYAALVNRIRSLAKGADKRYYITAAPQCPFPDVYIGSALNDAPFDAVYVQFYNNYCATSRPRDFNFDTWDRWAKTQSANPDVKVYIGAPASPGSAGTGYVNANTLARVAKDAQRKYSSFGGVMLWDVDSSYANKRYHVTIKKALSDGTSPNPEPDPGPPPPPPQSPPEPEPGPQPEPEPTPQETSIVPGEAPPPVPTPDDPPIPDPRAKGRLRRPSITVTQDVLQAWATPPAERRAGKNSRFFRI